MSRYEPIIVAHRGLHHDAPENSLAAFRAAWRRGFRWCECDIHFTADGHAVILHDETLDRTSNGAGRIDALTYRQTCGFRLRRADGSLSNERIPLLDDVLAAMPRGGRLLVEIKPPQTQFLIQRNRRCRLQSFHRQVLAHVRARRPREPLAWLIDDDKRLDAAARSEWQAIHLHHHLLDAASARILRKRGKAIGVWTVDRPDDIERVLQYRPEIILTDAPDRVVAALRRQNDPNAVEDHIV